MISSLSDNEVINNFRKLALREREMTLGVMVYLSEIEDRKLYLNEGYSSLFDLCRRGIGYSESESVKRIRGAKVLMEFPEARAVFERREISLSVLSSLRGVITKDNKNEILIGIPGLSKEAAGAFLAKFKAPTLKPVLEKVIPMIVSKPEPVKSILVSVSEPSSTVAERAPVPGEEVFKLQFSVKKDVMSKIARARELLSGKYPKGVSLENLLGEVLEDFIDRKDPARKVIKENKTGAATDKRHIPVNIKYKIFKDSNCQCSYEKGGVRCSARWGLEIDHKVPFAKGGRTGISNLRLLCRAHNQLMAEQEFGKEHIRNAIAKQVTKQLTIRPTIQQSLFN